MMLRKSSHDRRRGRLRRFAIVLIYWVVIALISPGFSQTESQPSNKTQAASQGRKTPLIPSEPPPTAGEAAAPNGERPKSLPTIEEAAEEETEEKEPEELPVEPEDLRIRRFGYDYFEGARRRILTLEATLQEEGLPLSSIKDAVSGFVGPVDMMKGNVNAIVPHSRVLRPGDRLTLIYWSEQSPLESRELVIDPQGRVILPEVGNLVARGMTLEQFERAAQELLSRKQFTDLKLIATLEEFHTIQIFITGYAFRPGGYAASAVTTLFNALYLCGGPSIDGAFRDIRLIRNGETTTVDFYKYLMDGDASQDVLLMAGDTIFIGPVGRLVTIEGEVKRPDTYELVPGENFSALLNMAGGLRPSGFAKVIQLESVSPNQERVLRE
jgi:protein involved in polysaccharide export with SLBB domain